MYTERPQERLDAYGFPAGSATGAHRFPRRRPRARVAALLAGGVLAVGAGIGGYSAIAATGSSTDSADAQAVTAAAEPAGYGAAAPAQQQGATLSGPNLGTGTTALGTVATNDGYTVYSFAKDSKSPSRSTCTGACEQSWPPVMATDTPWLKGVSSQKVGTVTRPDGQKQLTLGGWPVYRYAKDTAPGDTKGNGVGGTWCAVGPDGKPVMGGGGAWSGSGSSGSGSSGSSGSSAATPAPAAPAAPSSDGYSSGGY